MIWVERTPSEFVRARVRRGKLNGTMSDRASLWKHRLYTVIDNEWAFQFTRQHPLFDRDFR